MKKFLTLLTALCLLINSFASVHVIEPPKKASDIFIPIGKTGQRISLLDLARISVGEFEKVSGEHLNFTEKVGFKAAQKQLRNSINTDGTLNSKKIEKVLKKAESGSGFHFGGFALGFFLGLLGVLIAYLIKDDKKPSRTKWAWLGLGAIVLLYVLLHII